MNFAAPTPESAIAGMAAALGLMRTRFVARFGGPAALIAAGALYGKARETVLRWLHDMEAVVRRLLLLRAEMFPTPAARTPKPSPPPKTAPRRKEGDPESLFGPSDDPAQWRVSLRLPTPPEPLWMLGGFRAHEDQYDLGHRTEDAPQREITLASIGYWIDDPRPIAKRLEALLRVIDDPDHYAARLAQRLYAWRGREERRQLFLRSLCARTPIANEAGLEDSDWDWFATARDMALALLPVFNDVLTRAPALHNSS